MKISAEQPIALLRSAADAETGKSLLCCDRERREPDRQTQHVLLWERQSRPDTASRRADDLLHVQL